MTFSDIVAEIKDRLNLTSPEATARIGREVNARYRRVTSSVGLNDSRRMTGVAAPSTLASAHFTFQGIEKIERVFDTRGGQNRILAEVTFDELRSMTGLQDSPTHYAIEHSGAQFVQIRVNCSTGAEFNLYADGLEIAPTLSGTQVPRFAESFHDLLVEGVVADELKKMEKLRDAIAAEEAFERRLSDLRLFIAKSAYLSRQQGGRATDKHGHGGAGSGGDGISDSWTQIGLITFDRDPAAPFAVTDGSAPVPNLIAEEAQAIHNVPADRLVGRDSAGTGPSEMLTVGGGIEFTDAGGIRRSALTGDVSAPAGSGVTAIAPGVVTTPKLADNAATYAKLQDVSAPNRLLGRGASGAGDPQEITLGAGLAMTGTTLSGVSAPHAPTHAAGGADPVDVRGLAGFPGGSTQFLRADGTFATPAGGGGGSGTPGGANTQVQFNDAGAFAGDAGLVYDTADNQLTVVGPASALRLRATDTSRVYALGIFDGAGAFRFTRSDASSGLQVVCDNDIVRIGQTSQPSTLAFSGIGMPMVFCPTEGGGAGLVQFGRRMSDDNPGVGARVQFWSVTGQIEPALAVMAPGGASWDWAIKVGGQMWMRQSGTPASRLLGRGSAAGAGAVEELTLGAGLSLSGTVLSATGGGGGGAEEVFVGPDDPGAGYELWFDTDAVPTARTGALGLVIDGGGSAIAPGVKGFLTVPFACTITGWTLLSTDGAATPGSLVLDIWKAPYASYPPTVANSITASAKPTLSGVNKNASTSLTGWTLAVAAGDVLGFNVESAATVTRVAVTLTVQAG